MLSWLQTNWQQISDFYGDSFVYNVKNMVSVESRAICNIDLIFLGGGSRRARLVRRRSPPAAKSARPTQGRAWLLCQSCGAGFENIFFQNVFIHCEILKAMDEVEANKLWVEQHLDAVKAWLRNSEGISRG